MERGNPTRPPHFEEGGGLYFSSNQNKIFAICNEKLYYNIPVTEIRTSHTQKYNNKLKDGTNLSAQMK